MISFYSENGILKEIYNLKDAKKNIKIPDDVSVIKCESLSYTNLDGVEKIVVGKNVNKIDEMFCSYLKGPTKLELPKELKSIGNYCFEFSTIESVEFPDECTKLGYGLFSNSNIKEVKLGNKVRTLSDGFMASTKIRELEIPSNIANIMQYCFEDCFSLETLKLNEGVQLIDSDAFKTCPRLKNLVLPESLLQLSKGSFGYGKFESVTIKGERTKCKKFAFQNSVINNLYINAKNRNKFYFLDININKLNLFFQDGTIKTILPDNGCKILELKNFDKFSIMKQIDENNLESIKCIDLENGNILRYPSQKLGDFFETFTNELYLSETQMDMVYDYYYYLCLSEKHIDTKYYQNGLLHDAYKIKDRFLYSILQSVETSKYEEFVKHSKNFRKWANKVVENSKDEREYERNIKAFIRFSYNMGLFSDDNNIRVKCMNLLDKVKSLYGVQFNWPKYFNSWKLKDIQHERFRDFVCDNFDNIIVDGREDFSNKLYSNFADIQSICKHKSGRLLKVKFEDAIKYFERHKFNKIIPGNEDMANMVYKYYKDQLSFDALQELFEKAKNIVNDVTKYENYFEVQDNSKSEFTYEFLSKDDPRNLILGHLCDCCAHLGGAGQDIMVKSMTDENYCNLVIKDKNGEIKAKSTIYINKEKGYAVFNNVEVNKQFLGYDKNDNVLTNTLISAATKEQKLDMVDCLLRGANDFVKFYNSNKNHKPIFVVTMGMLRNDLKEEFMGKCRASRVWYVVPPSGDYEMDSQYKSYNQRILYYKNDNELGE